MAWTQSCECAPSKHKFPVPKLFWCVLALKMVPCRHRIPPAASRNLKTLIIALLYLTIIPHWQIERSSGIFRGK